MVAPSCAAKVEVHSVLGPSVLRPSVPLPGVVRSSRPAHRAPRSRSRSRRAAKNLRPGPSVRSILPPTVSSLRPPASISALTQHAPRVPLRGLPLLAPLERMLPIGALASRCRRKAITQTTKHQFNGSFKEPGRSADPAVVEPGVERSVVFPHVKAEPDANVATPSSVSSAAQAGLFSRWLSPSCFLSSGQTRASRAPTPYLLVMLPAAPARIGC